MDKRALIATALGYKFVKDFEITLHSNVSGVSKIQIVDAKVDLSFAVSVNKGEIEAVTDVNKAEEFAQTIFIRAYAHFPHLCDRDEELVTRITARIAKVANEYSYSVAHSLVGRSPDISVKFTFTNYDSGHVFVIEFPRSEFTRDNFKNIVANVTDRLKEMAQRKAAEKEALEASAIEVLLDKEEEEKHEAKEREERNPNAEADKVCKIIISHVEQYMTGNGYGITSSFQLNANSVRFIFMGQKDGVPFHVTIQIRGGRIIECCGNKNETADMVIKINRTLEKAINARNAKPSPAPVQEASKVKGFGAWGA